MKAPFKLLMLTLLLGWNSYSQRIADGTYIAEKNGIAYRYVLLTVNGNTATIDCSHRFKGSWFPGFYFPDSPQIQNLKADEFGQFVNENITIKLKNGNKVIGIVNETMGKNRYVFEKVDKIPSDYYKYKEAAARFKLQD